MRFAPCSQRQSGFYLIALSSPVFSINCALYRTDPFQTNEDRTLQDFEIELLNMVIPLLNRTKAFFMRQFLLDHPILCFPTSRRGLRAIQRADSCPQAVRVSSDFPEGFSGENRNVARS
jgi:hypothetical protein